MWIDSLSLRNFRGFRELDLDLRRQLTVLIGANGSGKSTVVHALRAASVLGLPVSRTPNLGPADLLLGETNLELMVAAAERTHWVRYEKQDGLDGKLKRSGFDESVRSAFPFVPCLDAGRSRLLDPGMSPNLGAASLPAHGMSRFEYAESWFRSREDLENEMRVETRQLDFEDPPLLALTMGRKHHSGPPCWRSRATSAESRRRMLTGDSKRTSESSSRGCTSTPAFVRSRETEEGGPAPPGKLVGEKTMRGL